MKCKDCQEITKIHAKGLCIKCYGKHSMRKYRMLHPEEDRQRKKEWRVKNREKWLFQHERSRIKRKYGLSMEQLKELKELQDGKCKICNKTMIKICIDHDHITGKVRALLCDLCNRGLGYFGDDPELMMQAAMYIRNYYKEEINQVSERKVN